jgi:glycosyltransferase involved in cell wall biosynthesis
MKKIKPIFGTHQIYEEIINHPPEGFKFLSSREAGEISYYKKKKLREKTGVFLQKLNIPRMIFVKPGDYDLIHSSRGIIPLNKKPWVMDIEHVHSFFGLNPHLIKKKFLRKFIEKKLASRYCKGILCHCDATLQAFEYYLDTRKFKNKLQVLYPASHIIPIKKEKHKKIRILSVLSLFEAKAGLLVLKAFEELEKKYDNIELWIKSDVPEVVKRKYNSKNIKYIPYSSEIVPREQLIKELYSKCDIFLYTTFCDSFGYSLIDALVAKLPIISTNLFAVPEIVEEGKNGFILKIPGYDLKKGFVQESFVYDLNEEERREFISGLKKSLEKLIKNKNLRESMSKESFKKVSEGDFSLKKRNKKLKKIYEDALR